MKAFILAGGFATRLWPLTEKRAKPLLPLAGRPIISHIVDSIPKEISVTVSTNAAFEQGFKDWKEEEGFDNVTVLIEDTASDDQKLGALGAVAAWITQENIDDDVLLLTGDNYFGFDMQEFLDSYNSTTLLAAHDIQDRESAKKFGTIIMGPTSVDAFDEKPAEPRSTLISTGCSILPKHTLPLLLDFAKQHPDNVGGIFEEFLRKNETIHCFEFNDPWFDIGSFDAYLDATKKLIGDELLCADTCHLHENTAQSSVVLGHNAHVTNSTLTDVVVFDDVSIDNCVLERCIVDTNCTLKGVELYGKMIRERTTLEQGKNRA